MILGVTGTRYNPSFSQGQRLYSFMASNEITEIHHGDCTGWDQLAYEMFNYHGIKTIAHPPSHDQWRAYTKSDIIMTPKPYLDRNKDIVNAVDFLVAAPSGPEAVRSGTWSTVRYAKKVGVKGVVWL